MEVDNSHGGVSGSFLGRRSEVVVATVVASVVIVLGSMWLNWFTVGGSKGNSFDMFRAFQLLGVDELHPLRVIWFVLPVVYLGAFLLLFLRKLRWAAGTIVVASFFAGGVAVAVIYYTKSTPLGPLAATSGSLCSIVSSAVLFLVPARLKANG